MGGIRLDKGQARYVQAQAMLRPDKERKGPTLQKVTEHLKELSWLIDEKMSLELSDHWTTGARNKCIAAIDELKALRDRIKKFDVNVREEMKREHVVRIHTGG